MLHRVTAVALVLFAFAREAGAQPTAAQPIARAACPSAASRRVTGASVGVIDSAAMAPFFHRTLSEALTGRVPGVSVMPSSGVAGAGSRVRLRGPGGIMLTQQPLLVIDGIRADGTMQSLSLDAGGQAPSRLDDVPVDDVECIIVLRGPATTARYGTDAAGGVIHVITRSARNARTDSARVRTFLEGGASRDVTDYPANFGNPTSCTRSRGALGQCATSPIRSWSPIEGDSPFRTAPLLHGGGRATIPAGGHTTLGVSASGTIGDGAFRENEHRQYAFGTNGSFRPDSTFSVEGNLWLFGGRADLPLVGNPIFSIINSASRQQRRRSGAARLPAGSALGARAVRDDSEHAAPWRRRARRVEPARVVVVERARRSRGFTGT
jgi:outer membrane receptor protein involved in Fe transport